MLNTKKIKYNHNQECKIQFSNWVLNSVKSFNCEQIIHIYHFNRMLLTVYKGSFMEEESPEPSLNSKLQTCLYLLWNTVIVSTTMKK